MSHRVPDDSRREIKFVADELHAGTAMHWFAVHPAGFYEPHPARWVSNIYFDTYDWDAFRQNACEASSRSKVRYRWYGDEPRPGPGALEIKCKRNCFSWKLRYLIDAAPYAEGYRWSDVRRVLRDRLPADGRCWLEANPQPVVLNRYFRRYLATLDGRIRVTIDDRQSVFDQRYKPCPNTTHPANLRRTAVIELKFARADHDRACEIVQGLPLRVGRNSKYALAVRAVQGY